MTKLYGERMVAARKEIITGKPYRGLLTGSKSHGNPNRTDYRFPLPTLFPPSCFLHLASPFQQTFRVVPSIHFYEGRDILCVLLLRLPNVTRSKCPNHNSAPRHVCVARSVEKKKQPIQGLGISKSTTPTERYPTMRVRVRVRVCMCGVSPVSPVSPWPTRQQVSKSRLNPNPIEVCCLK
ncbi:hypothetical protein CH063_02270 [Colletotrichum higginsianum]|uniref:Uncharacterized protein n=1 Tax=Colletotrichum higginsianum (strain IMI 349063) TaxID=759273 RepID=H1VIM3_COLHI|nr:hypothetical protein CH063_02270 [Colletotrichum higginsianum]